MAKKDTGFQLTHADRNSDLWRRLHAHYTARLADRRAANDAPASEAATAHARGRIHEIKELLALADPPDLSTPEPEGDDAD